MPVTDEGIIRDLQHRAQLTASQRVLYQLSSTAARLAELVIELADVRMQRHGLPAR